MKKVVAGVVNRSMFKLPRVSAQHETMGQLKIPGSFHFLQRRGMIARIGTVTREEAIR